LLEYNTLKDFSYIIMDEALKEAPHKF